jgi:GNAT superfamily N-acetyltransferase
MMTGEDHGATRGEAQMTTEIVEASTADRARVVTTIVLAFSTDPMTRWCWPNADEYLAVMPIFTEAFGGRAFESDGAHCTSDRRGAALWLPPGIGPDEGKMGQIAQERMPSSVRDDVYRLMERMAHFHPGEPHWYLPLIGVDPTRQGKGYGSALLSYALRQCDRDESLAYLESSNPRNIPLYERHGFRVIGEIQSGSSPTMVAMLRAPRSATAND